MVAREWPQERVRGVAAWTRVSAHRLGRTIPLVGVLALAGALRLPYMSDWPAFTDETREVLISLAVARGERLAWTNFDPYIGPWHIYLLAGLFRLAGFDIDLPRLLVLTLNVATVALTFLLGRQLGGTAAGLVAGGLASFSPMWIIVNSHVAWSASTTPLYAVGAVLLAQGALAGATAGVRRWGWPLAGAGLLLGLAAQTHPTALLLAPALALAVVWGRDGRRRLLGPWPWLALGAALTGYAPLLVYNVFIQPWGSIAAGQKIGYAWGLTTDPLVYAGRAPAMWWAQARMLAGEGERDLLSAWPSGLAGGLTLLALALMIPGLIVVWRRGERVVPFSLAALLLLLPFLTGYSGELFADRYAAPAIGPAAALIGVALTRLGRGRWWLAVSLAGGLTILPLTSLVRYYEQQGDSPNRPLMATAALLAPARACSRVILDQSLAHQKNHGGGSLLRDLRMAMAVSGMTVETKPMHRALLRAEANRTPDQWVIAILSPGSETIPGIMARLTLLDHVAYPARANYPAGVVYGVYVYGGGPPRCAAPGT